MRRFAPSSPGESAATLLVLACASVSPLIFTVSAAGFSSFHALALEVLVPAVVLWVAVAVVAARAGWTRLCRGLVTGLLAGVLATAALEVVRVIGFRGFDAMPGSMPELMGVLITDRFMAGPNLWSNLAGWADHVLNGVGFATIYVLLFGRPRAWRAIPYALGIGLVLLVSPVVRVTGAGYFGIDFGPGYAITVGLAHVAFGTVLGLVVARSRAVAGALWRPAAKDAETRPGPVAGPASNTDTEAGASLPPYGARHRHV